MSSRAAHLLGLRYLVSGANRHSLLVNGASVIGIALGVMLLVTVASILNGLAGTHRVQTLETLPHAFVPAHEASGTLIGDLEDLDGVVAVSPYFEGKALLSRSGRMYPVRLLGFTTGKLSPDRSVSEDWTRASTLDSGSIALTSDVAEELDLAVGSDVIMVVPSIGTAGIAVRPISFQLQEIFQPRSYFAETDGIVRLEDLEQRDLTGGGETGWRVWLHEPFEAVAVLEDVPQASLWIEDHGMLFAVWTLEKNLMLFLLLVVLVLASFSIASGQVMLINQKRTDIAILATMGASRKFLLRSLLTQGGVVSLAGLGLGLLWGCLAVVYSGELIGGIESLIGRKLADERYFETIPAEILWTDLLVITIVAGATCGVCLLRPAVVSLRAEICSMLK